MRRAARFTTFVAPLVVVLALSKVHAAWIADPPYDYTGSFRFTWSIAYAVVLAVAAYGTGLPDLTRPSTKALSAAVASSLAAAAAVSVVQLVVGDSLLPRFVVFGTAATLVPVQVVASTIATRGHDRAEDRERVVFVGRSVEAAQLVSDLEVAPERASTLAGELDVVDAISPDPHHKPLVDLVLARRATVVVLDRSAQLDETVIDQAAALHEGGVRVRTLLEFYEEWLGKLPLSELERVSLFFDISEIHRVRYGRLKRLTDVLIAGVLVVPLAVSVPVVAVGNLFANRGPLLFRQQRVGRGGALFTILKFRTMAPIGSEVLATEWTAADDPRVTPFGRFLRATHLDELPQVVNILRGDLSVVGPRPEQPHYVVQLSQKLPFYGMRHLVRPGLTGWAQVKYGYAGDERDALEKLQYEFFYLRHQSLRFDAKVMGRTVRSMAGSEGRGR